MNKILLIYDDYSELTTVEFSLKKVGFDVVAISSEFSTQEKLLSFNPEIVIAYGRGPKMTTIGVGKRLKDMGRWGGKAILIFPQGMKPDPQDLIRTRMDLLLEAPVPTVRLIQILAKMTNQDDQVLVEKLIKAAATEATEAAGSSSTAKSKSETKADSVFVSGKLEPGEETHTVIGAHEISDKISADGPSFEMNLEVEKLGEDSSSRSAKSQQFVLNPEAETIESDTDSENSVTPFSLGNEPLKKTEGKAPTGPDFKKEIEEAKKDLAERTKKYFQFTKQLTLRGKSSLQRADVRLAQKNLNSEWDPTEAEEQDDLRRNFVKALFKK